MPAPIQSAGTIDPCCGHDEFPCEVYFPGRLAAQSRFDPSRPESEATAGGGSDHRGPASGRGDAR